eukprot:GFUD01032248.1.p1 GENE.GFUD01032248.1~~GFUD01032248.1.p1  ORF type:complete len:646 (-),score=126.67 GFUD01032248.1:91-1830(-)
MARNQAVLNPENTVFEIKRLMGRHWDEVSVQEDIRRFPFRVQKLEEGRLGIKIKTKTISDTFSPEEISAAILSKMKNTAEDFLGMPVTNAVVTVPAYFNDAQRKATMDAAEIAGLNILRIINEPTAAAVAFGYGQKNIEIRGRKTQNLIVYDLGGGTFDVTVLKLDKNIYEVLSTNGDTHLGGADFDNNIVKYLLGVYNKKSGSDLKHSLNNGLKEKRAIQKITLEAENTKKALSSRSSMKIHIDSLYEGNDFSEQFSRAQFERANSDLFDKTTTIVSIALEQANLKISEVDEILLVGGSTKIPKIKSIVKNLFNGKTPVQSLNPDESVAIGAATLGAQIGKIWKDMESFLLLDVIPHSLGIESCILVTFWGWVPDKCDVFSIIIPKNTPVHEATKSHRYGTRNDSQESLPIIVYEGEDPTASKNHKLGRFDLTNIRIAPKGEVGMDVTFDINSDGILHVTAKEVGRENAAEITIISYQNRLTRGKIVKAIITEQEFNTLSIKAEHNEVDENVEIKRQETRETLERIIEKFFKVAKNMGSMTKDFVNEKRRWINANPGATEEEMRNVKKDLFDRMKGEL